MENTEKIKGFKQNLPTKICPVCGRPFQWRKKWKRNWDEIVYCSEKCKKGAKRVRVDNLFKS